MSRKLTKEEFIKRAIDKHGSFYNYDKVVYINSSKKVTITCPLHGDFEQFANDHKQGHGCKKCACVKVAENNRLSYENILQKANMIHNNKFKYSKMDIL